MASKSTHIHADATYKLIWQGFPVLVVGTTDYDKAFHPFGLAVSSNEKTEDFEFMFKALKKGVELIGKQPLKLSALISDASMAIKNGFKNIY